MAHADTYGLTRIKVVLDPADSTDWVAEDDFRILSYGFAPAAPGDKIVLGEYMADGTILGLPLSSTSGDPIGERWDTGDAKITPAIDRSGCTLSGATTVMINIQKVD